MPGKTSQVIGMQLVHASCSPLNHTFFDGNNLELTNILGTQGGARELFCSQLKKEQEQGGRLNALATRVSYLYKAFRSTCDKLTARVVAHLDVRRNLVKVVQVIEDYDLAYTEWVEVTSLMEGLVAVYFTTLHEEAIQVAVLDHMNGGGILL
ncbi:hypothetical protein K0U07_03765 [bacterium]|nr:hypothetical protein [bacterium]